MGTNYYLHEDICPHCGRCERKLHVGKSSGGWTFSFRGYPYEFDEPKIKSAADWHSYLLTASTASDVKNELRNEYDEIVTLHDFWELVADKRTEKNNHTIYMQNSTKQYERYAADKCWLDDEGNSFTGTKFS